MTSDRVPVRNRVPVGENAPSRLGSTFNQVTCKTKAKTEVCHDSVLSNKLIHLKCLFKFTKLHRVQLDLIIKCIRTHTLL